MLDDERKYLYGIAEKALLNASGAFLRIDRGDALFISDAPRRGAENFDALDTDFECRVRDGLLRLTPRFPHVPESLRPFYLNLMKSGGAEREFRLRKALAENMRLHKALEIEFLTKIWEEEHLC